MRSVLLCLVVLLSVAHLSSAGGIQSVTLWNDSSCSTSPINVATQFNLTETSQWPTLSSSAVSNVDGTPQCANVNFGAVQSGTYQCVNSGTGGWGLIAEEYNVSNCAGSPYVVYVIFGAPNSNCTAGMLEIISGPYTGTYKLWGTVLCNNGGSSSSAAPVAASSSSTGSPSTVASSSSSASPSPAASSSSAAGGATATPTPSSSTAVVPVSTPSSSSTAPSGPSNVNGGAERLSVAFAVVAALVSAMSASL